MIILLCCLIQTLEIVCMVLGVLIKNLLPLRDSDIHDFFFLTFLSSMHPAVFYSWVAKASECYIAELLRAYTADARSPILSPRAAAFCKIEIEFCKSVGTRTRYGLGTMYSRVLYTEDRNGGAQTPKSSKKLYTRKRPQEQRSIPHEILTNLVFST